MKTISYKRIGYTGVWDDEKEEVVQHERLANVVAPYSEQNEEIAKREAHNGEYTIAEVEEEMLR